MWHDTTGNPPYEILTLFGIEMAKDLIFCTIMYSVARCVFFLSGPRILMKGHTLLKTPSKIALSHGGSGSPT